MHRARPPRILCRVIYTQLPCVCLSLSSLQSCTFNWLVVILADACVHLLIFVRAHVRVGAGSKEDNSVHACSGSACVQTWVDVGVHACYFSDTDDVHVISSSRTPTVSCGHVSAYGLLSGCAHALLSMWVYAYFFSAVMRRAQGCTQVGCQLGRKQRSSLSHTLKSKHVYSSHENAYMNPMISCEHNRTVSPYNKSL